MMHHVHQHLFKGRMREIDEIYVSMSLRSFAISVVAIFIPIYLYKLGYSLQSILFFYMLIYVFKGLAEYFACNLVSRFGAKHIIALSLPLTSVSFIFLLTQGVYHWPLWILALANALPLSLFWLPYHDDLSKAKHSKEVGKEVGKIQFLINVSSALGPFIGGIIAGFFGMAYALLFATVVMMFAVVPLFKSPEITKRRSLSMKNFSLKRDIRDMIAYSGVGLENISSMIVWPLILFFIIESYTKLGSIATISLFVAITASIYMGKVTDKYEKRKVMRVSGITHSLSIAARFVATTVNAAYLVNILSSVTHVVMIVPFVSEFYMRADEEPRAEYILGMEIAVDIARALGFLVLFLLTYLFSTKDVLLSGILMGVFGALLTVLITTSKKRGGEELRISREVARARA